MPITQDRMAALVWAAEVMRDNLSLLKIHLEMDFPPAALARLTAAELQVDMLALINASLPSPDHYMTITRERTLLAMTEKRNVRAKRYMQKVRARRVAGEIAEANLRGPRHAKPGKSYGEFPAGSEAETIEPFQSPTPAQATPIISAVDDFLGDSQEP